MKRCISILAFSLLLGLIASAMTVEEAYRAIPHRYTPFDAKAAKMPANQSACLESFFKLVNLAIVGRIQTLAWFQSHGAQASSFENYQKQMVDLLTQLAVLPIPKNLEGARRYVVEAIKDQVAYFEEWEEAMKKGQKFKYVLNAGERHPRVLA